MQTIKVIKIGGNVVDNPEALSRFVADFAGIPGPKVLVHGGGVEATRMSRQMGIETVMIDGRRVTDLDTLHIVTMVYAGLVNKRIVAMLQGAGCNAIGMCGADAGIITATRRPAKPIDYGYVGDLTAQSVRADMLLNLCNQSLTPVICAVQYDGRGGLLNCNADSVATAVALAMSTQAPTDLVFCFDKRGVMLDIDNPDSLIPEITAATYPDLRSRGVINKGMIPKIENALTAVDAGLQSVRICHSDNLLNDDGTVIHKL